MGENNTSGEHRTPKPGLFLAVIVPAVGLAVLLAGCLVAWANANASAWFAYAPLSNQVFTGNGMAFVSLGTQIGLAGAVMGLLILAFWAGHRIGRRSGSE